jgi:glycosyltransferase involved in cell wall biosynthesis
MHIIPTGINPADFSGGDGARFRARLNIQDPASVQLFVGRVAFEKNIDFLLRAFAQALHSAPTLQLVIAGEGPAEGELKRLAKQLGVDHRTHFVGYLDRATELLDCYRAADAFVFASRTETQGLVLLEAMALGVPVISTAVMGTASIVGPRRGALVPDDTEHDFAAAMARLAADPALRAQLSRDARAYAAEWGAGAMAIKLSDLYAEHIALALAPALNATVTAPEPPTL